MTDFPAQRVCAGPAAAIHAGGSQTLLADVMRCNASGFASVVVTQNRACYLAFYVERPVTVYQIMWENGATINGNVDVGIYNEAGTRLVSSGSTAQSGASVVQVVNITDTALSPGTYFMAIASDSATATILRCQLITEVQRFAGAQWEASAFPLPTTATMSTVSTASMLMMSLVLRPEA